MGENTKHTLTKKALLSLVMGFTFLSPVLLFAQSAGDAASENSIVIQTDRVNEENYPITAPDSTAALSTGLGIGAYIRMIIVLAVVVIAIWLFARFFKKNVTGTTVDENPFMLRRVASISLGPSKSVQIVTLLDSKGYLLGVSDDGVSLLGTIDDLDLIQALNLNADKAENSARPKNFAEVLELFTKKKGSSKGADSESVNTQDSAPLDALKKQHTRLDGEA